MRKVILGVIWLYQQLISPMLPPRCRFYPTCSQYAAESVKLHGAAKGSWLSLKRIARCHPLNPGGVDLVPEAEGSARAMHGCCPHANGEHAHG